MVDLYYQVGEKKTTSKIQALEWAEGHFRQIKLHYLDDLFQKTDWTKEPEKDWETILRNRCIEIRNKHDYVILWYSGGWDSQTILDAFIRNKLKIDELVIYVKEYNDEGNEVQPAIDYAQKVKKDYFPNLKITVFSITAQQHINWYKDKDYTWIHHPGWFPNFSKTMRRRFMYGRDGVHNDAPKNHVIINGYEKPMIFLMRGKWFASFPDGFLNWVFDSPAEQFYIPENNSEIYLKQCWMAIRWLEKIPSLTPRIVDDMKSSRLSGKHSVLWNRACGRTGALDEEGISQAKSMLRHTEKVYGFDYGIPSESLNIIKDIVGSKEEYNVYKEGLDYVRKFSLSENQLNLPVIMSDWYYIKDYEDRSL